MKIELDVDMEEINRAVCDVLVRQGVDTLNKELFEEGRYGYARRMYKENVQDQVRKLIKARSDEIIDRAVKEASAIIARKALPKLLEKEI